MYPYKKTLIVLWNGNYLTLFLGFVQFIFSIQRRIRTYFLFCKTFPSHRKNFLIYASLLNCFTKDEISVFKTFNINKISLLRNFIAGNLSIYLHSFNRKNLFKKCKTERLILADKYKTLGLCPDKFKYNFLNINLDDTSSLDKNKNFFEKMKYEIFKKGIIIKPRYGSNSRNIINIRILESKIITKYFNNKLELETNDLSIVSSLRSLLKYLVEIGYQERNFLIMPYINSLQEISGPNVNVIFRIVTQLNFKTKDISIYAKWLEINFLKNKLFFLDFHRNVIPKMKFTDNEEMILSRINKFISNDYGELFNETINLAIKMHQKIGNIDNVAWDFIPSEEGPKLLEGNSDFNIFLPQLFHYLSNKKINISGKPSLLNI